jgi:hypothetical protein
MAIEIDLDLSEVFEDVCDIKQDSATTGVYGHPVVPTSNAGTVVAPAVACKLLPDTRRGVAPGGDKHAIVSKYILYLFPVPGVTFSEDMWVFIDNLRYNIVDIVEPVVKGAPYEFRMQRVKP